MVPIGDRTKPGLRGGGLRRGTRRLGPRQALRAMPLILALALAACALPFGVTIGGVGGKTIAPPSPPMPRLVWVADAGHAKRAAILQLDADPGIATVFALAGRASSGFGGPVMLPTADRLIAFDRATGSPRWTFDASTLAVPAEERRLSGFAVDDIHHHLLIAAGAQILILDGATGTTVIPRDLPPGVSCVNPPAPLTPPTRGADQTVTFLCSRIEANGGVSTVDVSVNPTSGALSISPTPTTPITLPQPEGIAGHVYRVTPTGLAVMAPAPSRGEMPIAELPFNVANPSIIAVDHTGADTGYIYLAGIGAQVVAIQDGVAGTPPTAPNALAASVIAQRAVALALAPTSITRGDVLPALPGFLITPGIFARAPCFDDAEPNTPGTATANTAITALSDGTFQVDLLLDVRDTQGHVAHTRHFVVAVAASGAATIATDTGDTDPFKPLPITPCPV